MPLKFGAMVEPVAVCVEALSRMTIQAGNSVCVIGCGPIGNLYCQILRVRGVQVTAIDSDTRCLSLLFKHDIDTLDIADDLAQYDFLIEGDTGEPILVAGATGISSNKRLRVGMPYQLSDSGPQGNNNVPCGSVAICDESWREAIQLIDSGSINLSDHISEIEPLESYAKVLAEMESGEIFKALLSVAPELKAL